MPDISRAFFLLIRILLSKKIITNSQAEELIGTIKGNRKE